MLPSFKEQHWQRAWHLDAGSRTVYGIALRRRQA
jgi:hypothetical protein